MTKLNKIKKGVLFVVSAPSGCGKGTILERVLKDRPEIFYSVSATTRKPRTGEIDGVNYYFYSTEEFEKLVCENGVLEYAQFCGNYYGTPRKQVLQKLDEGCDVILEIETKGAMQIKKSYPEAVLIFILPPSVGELRRRLEKRATEDAEVIEKRVSEASKEIEMSRNYDFVIVNDDLEKAINDFEAVMLASRFMIKNSSETINEVLSAR